MASLVGFLTGVNGSEIGDIAWLARPFRMTTSEDSRSPSGLSWPLEAGPDSSSRRPSLTALHDGHHAVPVAPTLVPGSNLGRHWQLFALTRGGIKPPKTNILLLLGG